MKKILTFVGLFAIILFIIVIFVFKSKEIKIEQNFSQNIETNNQQVDDKVVVEKYIRENIKNIVTEEPVLGGSWYLASIDIDTSTKTGTMIYEDGHIQGKANFNYIRSGEQVTINLTF